jgi:hypothetical protein
LVLHKPETDEFALLRLVRLIVVALEEGLNDAAKDAVMLKADGVVPIKVPEPDKLVFVNRGTEPMVKE